MSHIEVLRAAIRERRNILIVGSTGSGKTTLVNAILDTIAHVSPADRVISIEDTMELQCPVDNYVDLRAVAGVSMLDCLRACMRLKPTRIVVGEVRGAEAHVMLKSWNTGQPFNRAVDGRNRCLELHGRGLPRLISAIRIQSIVRSKTGQNRVQEPPRRGRTGLTDPTDQGKRPGRKLYPITAFRQ
jgi:type IV secretion system protein VirB11